MNIYFSCSLTGGREDEGVYMRIVEHLQSRGMVVPTAHLAQPDVMHEEQIVDPAEVYQRDMAWIEGCDAVIAEVSTPSHGVGYEIGVALERGKPVLCCYEEGRAVSKMLLGNSEAHVRVRSYRTVEEALGRVDEFLEEIASR